MARTKENALEIIKKRRQGIEPSEKGGNAGSTDAGYAGAGRTKENALEIVKKRTQKVTAGATPASGENHKPITGSTRTFASPSQSNTVGDVFKFKPSSTPKGLTPAVSATIDKVKTTKKNPRMERELNPSSYYKKNATKTTGTKKNPRMEREMNPGRNVTYEPKNFGEGDKFFDWLGKQVVAGAETFNRGIFKTLDYIIPDEEYLPPGLDIIGNVVSEGNKYYTKRYETAKDKATRSSRAMGTFAEIMGELIQGGVAAAPSAVMGGMMAHAGLGATGSTGLGGASAMASTTKVSLAPIVRASLKNPQTHLTLLQTLGPEYEQAIEGGANEAEALIYAFTSAGLGSLIEISGGIQKLPGEIVKGENPLKSYLKSIPEEAMEEVNQRLVSGSAEKILYNPDKEIFSATNEDAIINPGTMLKEAGMGGGVAALLGAPSLAFQSTYNANQRKKLEKIGEKYSDDKEDLINEGLESAPNSESFKLATELKSKLDEGEEISSLDLGRLVMANDKEIRNEIADVEEDEAVSVSSEADLEYNQDVGEEISESDVIGPPTVKNKYSNYPIDNAVSAVKQSREGARLAVTLGVNGAKAFRTVYTPEIARTVSSDSAMDGFRAVYNSAVAGKEMTAEQKAAAMKIPKIMQDIAFDSGKLDAQRAAQATYFGRDSGLIRDDSFKKANLKSRDIRILDAIAKVTGTQIRFVDTINEGSANASYGKGVISISLDSDDPVRVAMMHEVVHRLREVSPESYSFLAKFVTENMSEESYSFAFAAVKSQYSGENTDTISEEVIAHALGTIMGDSKKLDSLIKADRTTWEKLCDALHDIIVSIKRALRKGSGARLSEEQRRVFSELLDKYEGMESVLKEALDRTAAKTQQAQKNTAEAVKVKFSNKQIETLTENDVRNLLESSAYGEFDDGSYIPLRRNTPAILIKEVKEHTNGSFEIKDFPIVMKVEKVRQALEEEVLGEETRQHGISVDGMIEIIKGMDDPAYIILQENGRYVEVIRYYDGKKHAAWAVLDFGISKAEAYMNGYPGGKYNILVTAFDPDDLKSYMETNVEEIIYDKKTKGSLQSGSGSLFPSHLNSSPFYISIPETSEKSNPKFSMKGVFEETKDLVAMHNMSEQQLLDVLTRGQFIMPSVAVTNKGLEAFGDISVLFNKDTIDPNQNENNKLYGSDAWTPTQTELKKNPKFDDKATANALRGIRKTLGDFAPQIFKDNSALFKQNIAKADGSVYNAYAHNLGIQTAYAMESGLISAIPKDANGNVNTTKLQSQLDAVLDKDSEWRKYKRWLSDISNKIITSYDKASNEDILRDMKSQPDYAKKFRLSVDGELTAPVVEYSSIEEFRNNKGRLSDNAEQDASALGQAFLRWATDISAVSGADANKIVSVINSAFDSRYSGKDIVKAFADKDIAISSKRADSLQLLYKKAVELSTPYFEAKPQRGVGVNEIAAVVLPSNASAELLSKLREAEIDVVTYQSGNNTDRIEKMNSVDEVKFSKKWNDGTDFDYSSLITKPDMLITEIDDSITYTIDSATRKRIIQDALDNAKRVGKTNARGEVFVYVDDIGENVLLSKHGLQHGLDRRLQKNATATISAGEILKNSICINKIVPKKENVDNSYVLIGVAKNKSNEPFVVEFVVNGYSGELENIDVLYSLNSKKEESAVPNAPAITEKPLRITDSKISIADLIELSRRHFPDILPESVLRHFGYTSRPEGELGRSALFSRKWNDAAVREIRQLKSENREITRKIEYLRGQFKRTPEGKIDSAAIRKLARELVSTYAANVSSDSIMTEIEELYDYISVDGLKKSFSLDEMWERATKLARDIAENSIERNDSMYREYADLRKYVRTAGLSLSETDRADIPDFNDFRRRYFGKIGIKSGKTNVDSVYHEMSSLWPEFFDEEKVSHPADQLMHIAKVVDDLYSIDEYNPYSADMDSAVEMIANDIISRYTDMPHAKKTFADRAADKVHLEKVRGDARVKKALERISKYQKESETRASKIRERYREKTKEGQKKQRERELRGKIMRATHRMDMTLRRPSDKKRIPQELQVPVANLLKAINLEGMYTYDENGKRVRTTDGTPTQRTLAFRELRDIYKKISGKEDMIVVSSELLEGDASAGGEILEQVVQLQDIPLHSMNEEQLSTVWKAIRIIESSVRTANKMFSDKHFKTISDAAEAIKNSARGKDTRIDIAGVSKVQNLVALDSLTPEAYFHRLGSGGEAIFRMLRDAQDKHTLIIDEIREFASGLVDGVKIHKLETTTHKVVLGGEEVTLSTAQLMELYALSKREQAEKHILEGGIRPERIPGVARVIRNTPIKHISPEEIGNAFENLTDEDKKMSEKLSDFASKNLGTKMNDACLKVFGYEKFGERHYWPIRTDPTAHKSDAKEVTKATPSISNYGMAKATTPGANTPLLIGSIFDTFSSHSAQAATYAAYLEVMEDFRRIFNFSFKDADGEKTGNIKGILNRVFGSGGTRYWENLMEDISVGIKGEDSGLFDGILRQTKAASVAMNIRVMAQQPTAILRAGNLIDYHYIVGGMAHSKRGWNRAKKYAPIAKWKSYGFFDANTGPKIKSLIYDQSGKLEKLREFGMAGAGMMDSFGWGTIWSACELELRGKIARAKNSSDNKKTPAKTGERAFSEDTSFKGKLAGWNDLSDGTRVKVGTIKEGSALNQVGLPASSLFFDVGKIKKAMSEHSDHLTEDTLKKIPELLKNPIVITEYTGAANTVNVYGELFIKGRPVVVGLVMRPDVSGKNIITAVRTIHMRSNAAKQITDATILYLNEDKERTRSWFQVCDNLNVPLDGTQYGLIRSISYDDRSVNIHKSDNSYAGIEPDTEEFYNAVAERFTEIIDHTQVVDGVLQRSQIMRSSNALTKMATSYMSEPTKVVNMFSNAVYDTTHAKTRAERKAAGKRLVRTSFSLLVSFAVNAALGQALVDALRDDDKEKEYWEKWMDAFTENFTDSLNPLTYFPYIKDAYSIYEGYSVGRMDLGGIENLIESTRNVIKAFSGESKYTVEGTINNACAVIGSLFGLGTANVKRDVRAAAMLFATGTDNYVMEYRMEKGLLELTYEKNGNVFYDILFKAYSNDRKAFEIIYNDMVEGGFDGEKIKKALEKRMKKAQGVEEVTDLDERFLSPKQTKEYNSGMSEVRKSPIWKKATEKHRKNLENDVYNIVVGNSDGQKLRTKMDEAKNYGIDSTEYLLYQLARDVVDKPSKDGKYGTITNEELKDAFKLVGFSKKEKAYLWEAEGNSRRTNPYR